MASFAPLKTRILLDSVNTGNYVKVKVNEHFFDVDTWRSMGASNLRKADIITTTKTRFSVFELWVYEYEYMDSVFFFDDGILTAMW